MELTKATAVRTYDLETSGRQLSVDETRRALYLVTETDDGYTTRLLVGVTARSSPAWLRLRHLVHVALYGWS